MREVHIPTLWVENPTSWADLCRLRRRRRLELVRKMATKGLDNDEMDELERINAEPPARKP